MLLVVDIVAVEEVEVLVAEVAAEDEEEEVDEAEEYTDKEVAAETAEYMKRELISHMSPITLNINSGPQYKNIQGRGSLRAQCAQSSWPIKEAHRQFSQF